MNKVVFYEVFEEELLALKAGLSPDVDAVFFSETIQEARHEKAPGQILCIRTQSYIPESWAEEVRGILTRSTGYDHLERYRRRVSGKIAYGYLPAYCSRAVAEQALLMLMSLYRKLPRQMVQFKRFCRDGLMGHEVFGKRLCVVGVGRIGSECARMAKGLGMLVKGVDIEPRERDVDYASLDEGIRWADAVICALPLTVKTRGLFSDAFFSQARQGLVFVNVGRGEISPLNDLELALSKGWLGGAGLDVYDNEARVAEALRTRGAQAEDYQRMQGLMKKYNVLFTPHNAFNTAESVSRKASQTAESLRHFMQTGSFVNEIPTEKE